VSEADAPSPKDAREILHTFWQSGSSRWQRRGAAAAAALALVGALGYGYYARGVVSDGPGIPARPAAPKRDLRLATTIPVPADEAIAAAMASFGRGSGQLPDDRHELD
jgi:hypothetical protein